MTATSVVAAINNIDTAAAEFGPAIIVGVQASELAGNAVGADGTSKLQALLAGIQAGAQVGETIPVPVVASISGLANLVVSIFNVFGFFKHKTP